MNEYIAAAVDELFELGVRHVVFSGGSRSTSMAVPFMAHGGYKTYMNIDERSAGFFASVWHVCIHRWLWYAPPDRQALIIFRPLLKRFTAECL